jgi:hypothetical protein
MLWKSGNVELRIWPLGHCPPHVTAVCRADNWTARFEFSMVTDRVSLIDVKPLQNEPALTLLRTLAHQVLNNRQNCHAEWWRMQQTACLDNKPVERLLDGNVVLSDAASTLGTGTVVKGSGLYLAGQGVQVRVRWNSGITKEILTEV